VNISEKLSSARMNNTKSSPRKRQSAHARQVEATVTLKRASVRFPSYLHVFGSFFQHFHGRSCWGIAASHLSFSDQFRTTPASVAFV
jgi:hypothetical protein